jgi:hypothetical protein
MRRRTLGPAFALLFAALAAASTAEAGGHERDLRYPPHYPPRFHARAYCERGCNIPGYGLPTSLSQSGLAVGYTVGGEDALLAQPSVPGRWGYAGRVPANFYTTGPGAAATGTRRQLIVGYVGYNGH